MANRTALVYQVRIVKKINYSNVIVGFSNQFNPVKSQNYQKEHHGMILEDTCSNFPECKELLKLKISIKKPCIFPVTTVQYRNSCVIC